jgi:hypothetical protein
VEFGGFMGGVAPVAGFAGDGAVHEGFCGGDFGVAFGAFFIGEFEVFDFARVGAVAFLAAVFFGEGFVAGEDHGGDDGGLIVGEEDEFGFGGVGVGYAVEEEGEDVVAFAWGGATQKSEGEGEGDGEEAEQEPTEEEGFLGAGCHDDCLSSGPSG